MPGKVKGLQDDALRMRNVSCVQYVWMDVVILEMPKHTAKSTRDQQEQIIS